MKRILITGGGGFIGRSFIQQKKNKYNICSIDIDNSILYKLLNYSISTTLKLENCDITNNVSKLESIIKCFKPDVVLHLAAQSNLRTSIRYPITDAFTNIIGSINVIQACIKYNVKKFIYTSTGGARYGFASNFDEFARIHPVSPYGISKHTVEHYLNMYHFTGQFYPTTLCFGNVYGPNDIAEISNRIIPTIISMTIKNEMITIYGDGNQSRDFVFIDDIIGIIDKIINRDETFCGTIYNIGSGKQHSLKEILDIVYNTLNKRIQIQYKPKNSNELYNTPLDITKAKKELNWKPKTPFKKGLIKTIKWYENYLK